ncbi:glycosyltransferase [Nostoc parmelioides]|uniref:Glycosyltransferase n=1 Tax=Nostoc parmelioides FACHB-3921 TaxID=2692909 RepID=A0ABR8BF41_9NOSO|nr:glycosyltransferase [Nostoc parmelioides]MBD2251573.1 glycosyltransferase [Nostoc parmelioides FACHB-3921]
MNEIKQNKNNDSNDNVAKKELQEKIAIFLPNLDGGGVQKVVINLLKGLVKRGIVPDLILTQLKGPLLAQVPEDVKIICLNSKMVIPSTIPLAFYLKREKPKILISHLSNANVAAVMAQFFSHISTRVVLVEHTTLSANKHNFPNRAKLVPTLMRLSYPLANSLIAVSKGTSRDLERELGLQQGLVKTIYNPVIDDDLILKMNEPLKHQWFLPNQPPVFLSVGRLTKAKDHRTLITAFANLRSQISARLLILGEGELRSELEALIKKLGVESDVLMPGFVSNPYAYMSRASAFVLSSQYEALPTVLIEAMACGCPVVSTDCPHGPAEILENGKYGLLTLVKDPILLADAMQKTLDNPTEQNLLFQRAKDFNTDYIVSQYLETIGFKNYAI